MRKSVVSGLLAALFLLAASSLIAAPVPGGTMRIGCQPISNLDPHFATSIADITLLEQVYQHLTFIDPTNKPVADLATRWQSTDGKVWVFTLRSGAGFSNGAPVTAEDVVFTFNRLRDPKVGSPAASLFKGIQEVKALDSSRVQFTLRTQSRVCRRRGRLPRQHHPARHQGPRHRARGQRRFHDRLLLRGGPSGSEEKPVLQPEGRRRSGSSLPGRDRHDLLPDLGGQVEALRGGQLEFVGGLSTQFADAVKADPHTRILTNNSNMHWVLHMRADQGHPAADNRVRQALKLGTDQQALINAVRPGLAAVGNGFSPIGPAFGDYYLDQAPKVDVAKAKKLLADAGYPNGLKISLAAQNQLDVIPIATVWKDQMSKIGVQVDIQVVPSDVYYGEGDQSWLKADFGITDWGSRATPVTYFKLAYMSDSQWNESHWSDAQFDQVARQVDKEMDRAKRASLYRQAQQILIERGPVIVTYFEKAVAGTSAKLEGVTLASDWARTRFTGAYLAR